MHFLVDIDKFRIPEADILRIVNDEKGDVMVHMRRVGRRIVTAARVQVGKETGGLARSIHYRTQKYNGLPETWIGSYHRLAYIHHEGTRPHAITARDGGFLRFSAKGRVVYDRTVMHPGTRPNRFLTDNIYLARL